MKKYRIREGSPLACMIMALCGLAFAAIIGIGMNEVHPLF